MNGILTTTYNRRRKRETTMAESETRPTYKPQTSADARKGNFVGTQSGKAFPTTAEVNDKRDWDDFKREKNLSFTAQRKQHEPDFASWRKKRVESKDRAEGQKQAARIP